MATKAAHSRCPSEQKTIPSNSFKSIFPVILTILHAAMDRQRPEVGTPKRFDEEFLGTVRRAKRLREETDSETSSQFNDSKTSNQQSSEQKAKGVKRERGSESPSLVGAPRTPKVRYIVNGVTSVKDLVEHHIDPRQVHHQRTQDSPSRQHFCSNPSPGASILPSDLHYDCQTPDRHFNYGLLARGTNKAGPLAGKIAPPVFERFPYHPPSPEKLVEYLSNQPVDETEDYSVCNFMTELQDYTAPPLLAYRPDFDPYRRYQPEKEDVPNDGMGNYITNVDFDSKPEYLDILVELAQIANNGAPCACHPLLMFLWERIASGSYTPDDRNTVTELSESFDQIHRSLQRIADESGCAARLFRNDGDYDDVLRETQALTKVFADDQNRQVLDLLGRLANLEWRVVMYGQQSGSFEVGDLGIDAPLIFKQRCMWNMSQRASFAVRTPSPFAEDLAAQLWSEDEQFKGEKEDDGSDDGRIHFK